MVQRAERGPCGLGVRAMNPGGVMLLPADQRCERRTFPVVCRFAGSEGIGEEISERIEWRGTAYTPACQLRQDQVLLGNVHRGAAKLWSPAGRLLQELVA